MLAPNPYPLSMRQIKQYDTFILAKDINPVIVKGMRGVVLDIWSEKGLEVEFVKEDATNYEYQGNYTFTVDISYIGEIV